MAYVVEDGVIKGIAEVASLSEQDTTVLTPTGISNINACCGQGYNLLVMDEGDTMNGEYRVVTWNPDNNTLAISDADKLVSTDLGKGWIYGISKHSSSFVWIVGCNNSDAPIKYIYFGGGVSNVSKAKAGTFDMNYAGIGHCNVMTWGTYEYTSDHLVSYNFANNPPEYREMGKPIIYVYDVMNSSGRVVEFSVEGATNIVGCFVDEGQPNIMNTEHGGNMVLLTDNNKVIFANIMNTEDYRVVDFTALVEEFGTDNATLSKDDKIFIMWNSVYYMPTNTTGFFYSNDYGYTWKWESFGMTDEITVCGYSVLKVNFDAYYGGNGISGYDIIKVFYLSKFDTLMNYSPKYVMNLIIAGI